MDDLNIADRLRTDEGGWIRLSNWACPNCGAELRSYGGNTGFCCDSCKYSFSYDMKGHWKIINRGRKLNHGGEKMKYKIFKEGDKRGTFYFKLSTDCFASDKISLLACDREGKTHFAGRILSLDPSTGRINIFDGINKKIGIKSVRVPCGIEIVKKDC